MYGLSEPWARLGNCFQVNRIKRETRVGRVIDAIAFAGILKLHRSEIGVGNARDDRVGHTVN